ncbi:phenylalanine--tRNA ligase subunit beta [Wolbachia pipientis]|uniref:Phenylalanine--tRNA ligase beta subunit n=1 Tax=Wolbachia pipientis TaxID=955 RepID=A0A1E7QIU2_WOLPI|nr:phenylalanine--tRNA ligase subunit beta [Wolbachia pipientis]OEY86375.1 phenylalanine--tRNA ligase subunit beta [Wolbachia pipientis]
MKFTLSWLLEYLETEASLEEIVNKLTHIGLEVENVSTLEGIVITEVLEVIQHPNANKLKLCRVNSGNKILQVICGANNVRQGMKTVLASVGSRLPGSDLTIKASKIRGVLSEGMLCSSSELALTKDDGEGIIELSDDYKIGNQFFNRDPVIDVNITPNRGDCLSVYGIARDLSATGIGTLRDYPEIHLPGSISNSHISVEVTDGESFISGRYIANIKNKESPKWLQDRLESIGIRSISTVVDIANYIMISYGQPMHVYDADKINRKLVVRKTYKETFTALNGKKYLLNDHATVIADEQNIYAIAGIIGGRESECTNATSNIFIESAWFNPVSIATSSRQLNISTDSSYRFARSIDPKFTIESLNIATQMVIDLCGGEVSGIISASNLQDRSHYINFNYHDIQRLGSVTMLPEEAFNILTKLGFKIDKITQHNWNVHVPSWRSDMTIAPDLVEEVIRIYGYDKIKEEPLISQAEVVTDVNDNIRVLVSSRGFYEVLTWSFMSSTTIMKFGYKKDELLVIENPLNEHFDVMRPTIIPNLLHVASNNVAYDISDFAIFEIGPTYHNKTCTRYSLGGIRLGNNVSRNHYDLDREVDVFDVKADFISVLKFFNVNCDIGQTGREYYHPGKSGSFLFKNKVIGYFGELHPAILDFFSLKQRVVAFEIALEDIIKLPIQQERFVDCKYQSVRRDFAFIVDKKVKVGDIMSAVKKSSKLVTEIVLFDIYHGDKIVCDKISIALSVTFCSPNHTLVEDEIQRESDIVIKLVERNFGGILRDK